MRFSSLKRLTYQNVKNELYAPGVYKLFDRFGRCIYIGVSHKLRHRLESHLYARSDYRQVPGKMRLHNQTYYYATCYTTITKARNVEHNQKKYCKFNKL
jgi:excinuclease UvrABC nuclease subunit